MLARTHRLRSHKEVTRVYKQGRSVRSEHMSLKWISNDRGRMRAAVVVSKKVSAKAPTRNRIRRRIFEILRQLPELKNKPVDMVISVHSDKPASMPAETLKKQLIKLLQKHR